MTWPPKTRCQPTCGERPRNRFTSIGSRSRVPSKSLTAEFMDSPDRRHAMPKCSAPARLAFVSVTLGTKLRSIPVPALARAQADLVFPGPRPQAESPESNGHGECRFAARAAALLRRPGITLD